MVQIPRMGAAVTALLAVLVVSVPVSAEPLLVNVEGAAAVPLTEPQSDDFGPGGAVCGGVMYPLSPVLLVGARLRLGLLLDGEAPADGLADPSMGGLGTLSGAVRFRPLALLNGADGRRGVGPYLEVTGGGAMTGELLRTVFDAGIGWGFEAGSVDVAPTVRFMQVFQSQHALESRDARLLLAGVEFAFFDEVTQAPPAAPPPPADSDDDGVPDYKDGCPDDPEDFDDFMDEDGCPEQDNDEDGLADGEDTCPDIPEDVDGFEDEDGCPDPDNDKDGFADLNDSCPNEPETVNGNKDFDGCPDEGVIEMIDDRVVLEERVLFDVARSRVKSEARPLLREIVKLQKHHPEWISLRVEGHTDVRGTPEYNQCLSARRAANVRRELIKMGIPADMIDAVGYGSMTPRDRRNTLQAHRRNRRVEFVVMARRPAEPQPEPQAQEAAKKPKKAATKAKRAARKPKGADRKPKEADKKAKKADKKSKGADREAKDSDKKAKEADKKSKATSSTNKEAGE